MLGVNDVEIDPVAALNATMCDRLNVPAGIRYLHIALEGEEAGKDHLGVYLFDGNCEVVDFNCAIVARSLGGNADRIEVTLPGEGSYFIGVHQFAGDSGAADFTLSWWLVPDGPGNLVVDAPAEVVANSSFDVTIAWPEGLAAGRYLGILEHANEHVSLHTTRLEVTVP